MWPGRAREPGPHCWPALPRLVQEARNHLRLVARSVAAYSAEAQEVQEGLSKVRGLQGTGWGGGGRPVHLVPWGHAAIPLPPGRAAWTKPKYSGVGGRSLTPKAP